MQERKERQILAGGHAPHQRLTGYNLWSFNVPHISEQERRSITKSRGRNYYNHTPSEGTRACDEAVDDPVLDLLEGGSYFVKDGDAYMDVTALIYSCRSPQRDEYGKWNLEAEKDFEKLL